MSLIESLKWRYAVKKYSNKLVDEADVQKIIEAINLSATSTGLQPYRVIVISDKALQAKLGTASFNPQIVEASHLLVFAAFDQITPDRIDSYFNLIANVRQIPLESLAEFKGKLQMFTSNRTDEENFVWVSKQAYIGLGTAMVAAAELKIDTTPMEGFDAVQFDEILQLKEKGLKSVVVLALGYRDEENDIFSKFKKVRLPLEEFTMS